MGRKYVRVNRHIRNGKTHVPYNSFSKDDLKSAMEMVMSKEMTIRSAAKHFNIPKSTLARHCKTHDNLQKRAGRPTLFSSEEENIFVDYCLLLSEWGFPLDKMDLRVFAQRYLNKIGRTIPFLKDNLPGPDWAQNFVERHQDRLSNRLAANISSARAKTAPADIDNFFKNFSETMDGIKPENVINFDETNLTDDPGAKKYIFKRGTKYPERIINNSKTAISVMFSGAANGEMLPLYVVYKSENLWDQWTIGGPEKTRYNRSKSGWFDNVCFEDWFFTVVLPYFKNKTGRKLLVGDNLSSHFSERVLKKCEENDIKFVCLPPNSTHLLQPLDVAFFAPLKRYWRDILTQWKATVGRKHKTLNKSDFPNLLSKLYNRLMENDTGSKNIQSGFEKCGLYPLNPNRPKSRLPQEIAKEDVNNVSSNVVLEMLQEIRGGNQPSSQNKRKKRLDVQPGKSITVEDLQSKSVTKKSKDIQIASGSLHDPEVEINYYGIMSSDEENINHASLNKTKKRRKSSGRVINNAKKLKLLHRSSTTSEESNDIAMSIHSDSDIMDIPDDDSNMTYCEDVENVDMDQKRVDKIESQIWKEIEMLDQISSQSEDKKEDMEIKKTCTSEDTEMKIRDAEIMLEDLKRNEETKKTEMFNNTNHSDLNTANENVIIETDSKNNSNEEDKMDLDFTDKKVWNEGDNVIVRYFMKKSWKYYIGNIEAIDNVRHIYSITFYKTIKKGKTGLKFAKGCKDKDEVPYSNIVKAVQLQPMNNYFILESDEDVVYF